MPWFTLVPPGRSWGCHSACSHCCSYRGCRSTAGWSRHRSSPCQHSSAPTSNHSITITTISTPHTGISSSSFCGLSPKMQSLLPHHNAHSNYIWPGLYDACASPRFCSSRVFCAGVDFQEWHSMSQDKVRTFLSNLHSILCMIKTLPSSGFA
jgi:hypothetical protein